MLARYQVGGLRVSAAAPRTLISTQATTSDKKWFRRETRPNMLEINSAKQLSDAIANAGNKLVLVDFFASWCNACRALYPKLCQVCDEQGEEFMLLKVNFGENKELVRTLGVKVLPYFQVYRGGDGKIDEFSASVSKIQRLKEAIEQHSSPRCPLYEPSAIPELQDLIQKQESAEEAMRQLREEVFVNQPPQNKGASPQGQVPEPAGR